jgi:hypothetical protein
MSQITRSGESALSEVTRRYPLRGPSSLERIMRSTPTNRIVGMLGVLARPGDSV